jgi:hypothetical protein
MKTAAITITEYQGFQKAYDFFNRELFSSSLPQVLVTLQRHANTRGYFSPERFQGRIDTAAVHELALNPDNFTGRTDEMILSTLVHETAIPAGPPSPVIPGSAALAFRKHRCDNTPSLERFCCSRDGVSHVHCGAVRP